MDYVRREDTEEQLLAHFDEMDDSCIGYADVAKDFVFYKPKYAVCFKSLTEQTLSFNTYNTPTKVSKLEYSYDGVNYSEWQSAVTTGNATCSSVTFESLTFGNIDILPPLK